MKLIWCCLQCSSQKFLVEGQSASFRFFSTASPQSTFSLLTERKLSIDLEMRMSGSSFFETPWWIPISSCDITKAKSRLSGLQTIYGKSGKLKKIDRLIFMFCIKVRLKISVLSENYCSWSNGDIFKPRELKKERAIVALERFRWGPSLDLLWDSRNGALWLEHCFLPIAFNQRHFFKYCALHLCFHFDKCDLQICLKGDLKIPYRRSYKKPYRLFSWLLLYIYLCRSTRSSSCMEDLSWCLDRPLH